MDIAAVKDFFNNPDKWQNFEYMTTGGATSVFATNMKGFVRKKKVVDDNFPNRWKITKDNFYLTTEYKVEECEPFYAPYDMYDRESLRVIEDGKEVKFREINQSDALSENGNKFPLGTYVKQFNEKPLLDENGYKIALEEPNIGSFQLDEELMVVRWIDCTTGIVQECGIESIEMLAYKPFDHYGDMYPEEGYNKYYPGQGLIY